LLLCIVRCKRGCFALADLILGQHHRYKLCSDAAEAPAVPSPQSAAESTVPGPQSTGHQKLSWDIFSAANYMTTYVTSTWLARLACTLLSPNGMIYINWCPRPQHTDSAGYILTAYQYLFELHQLGQSTIWWPARCCYDSPA
jgi:hypothetical protein